MKLAAIFVGVIAFIIGLTALLFATSMFRKKLGKPSEKSMISKFHDILL